MFGKPLSRYLDFQKAFRALIVVVGLLRLALSLAGLPDATVRWASMNVPLWIGTMVPSLLLWGVASLAFRITKSLAPRRAVA